MPSAFRREAKNDRFVLIQWKEPSLSLFPKDTWNETEERLLKFRRNQPESWGDVLGIVSNAVEVVPDKQGRILVPAWLQKAASLENSVLWWAILTVLSYGIQHVLPRLWRIHRVILKSILTKSSVK